MKKIVSIIVFLAAFSGLTFAFPGGEVTEATIVYEIDMSGAEMDAMSANMLKNSSLTIQFKDKNMRTEFDMGIVNTSVVADGDKKNGLMLMNMMGTKWAIKMTEADFDLQEESRGEFNIEYTDETKEIAGYKCKKAIIKSEDGNSIMYFTEEIVPASINTNFTFSEIKGFPLSMEIDQGGMKMKMVAKEVKKDKLGKDVFNQDIPEGYEVKTMEDLKMFGGQ